MKRPARRRPPCLPRTTCDQTERRSSPTQPNIPLSALSRRCHQRRPGSRPPTDEVPAGSLLDEYASAFATEIDCLDLLLASVANLIDTTARADDDIPIRELIEAMATTLWRRQDHEPDSDLGAVAVGFLVDEAAWLIAYSAGVPGSDRADHIIAATLDWLQAAPRPLRSQLIRAATRYLF